MPEIISTLLIILLIVREVISYLERKDMLDRLMAKGLPEYKDNVVLEESHVEEVEDDGLVSLDDAKEEILNDKEE